MPPKPPRLPENYEEAALRHWGDAEFLKDQRIAAADHHVGIAVECSIKHAMKASSASKNNQHINLLWRSAPSALDSAQFPQLVARLGGASPFDAWEITDRYADTVTLETDIKALNNGISQGQARRDATAAILLEADLKP